MDTSANKPRLRRSRREKHLTNDEALGLLRAAVAHSERDYTMLAVALNTGLRVTELVKLRFEDFNALARTMLVKTAKQKMEITDEQHVADGVLRTVDEWSKHTGRSTGYLFDGGKPDTHLTTRAASMVYYKHAETAGLDIASRRADQKGRGIHSTRHHYTTRLLVKGKPIQASIVLRHRNSESLSQYCASQDERRFVELAGVIHGH